MSSASPVASIKPFSSSAGSTTTSASMTTAAAVAAVRGLQFSPHDRWKIGGIYDDGTFARYDVRNATGPADARIMAHAGSASCFQYHPFKDVIATGGRDKHIRVWDLAAADAGDKAKLQKEIHAIPTAGPVAGLSWHYGGTGGGTVASVATSRSDPTAATNAARRQVIDTPIASYCMSAGDYRVSVWNLRRPYIPEYVIDHHDAQVTGLAWSSTSSSSPFSLWTSSRDQSFVVHDLSVSCPIQPINCVSHQAFAWGPDDEFVLFGLNKSRLRHDGLTDQHSLTNRAVASSSQVTTTTMTTSTATSTTNTNTRIKSGNPERLRSRSRMRMMFRNTIYSYKRAEPVIPVQNSMIGFISDADDIRP
ncbi:WD40-repeat-containing domain protein [Lipomyces japonicus]|uniref:WD40-repeat-containing domain protein n=1 Tax=Lipomyces japonicus TaxID=56871 RepID=UPI0034CFC7E1